jgi:hypothetical protein
MPAKRALLLEGVLLVKNLLVFFEDPEIVALFNKFHITPDLKGPFLLSLLLRLLVNNFKCDGG